MARLLRAFLVLAEQYGEAKRTQGMLHERGESDVGAVARCMTLWDAMRCIVEEFEERENRAS